MADRKPIVLGSDGHPAALPSADRVLLDGSGLVFGAGLVQMLVGAGSPEGVVTAPVGSVYMQTDGNYGRTLWFKEVGATSTGWTSSDPWTYVKLTGVQSSTVIAAAATLLTFTPAANTLYEIDGRIITQSTVTTTGAQWGVNFPTAGVVSKSAILTQTNAATATVVRTLQTSAANNTLITATGAPVANQDQLGWFTAILETGAAPTGDVTVTLASEIAASSVSIRPGSFIRYKKVP